MVKFTVPFTESGFLKIKNEYNELLAKRPHFVEELARARDMGDRSENAAYKSARRTLSSTDSKLRFLKRLIDNARVIKPTQNVIVEIGSKVTVDNGTTELIFTIVGEHEADPSNGYLSFKSPVGRALLQRKVNDTITISIPNGTIEYKIKEIFV